MELGIETKVEGEIIEAGSIAIDAKIFSEIVRKLPDNDVVIEVNDETKANISPKLCGFKNIKKIRYCKTDYYCRSHTPDQNSTSDIPIRF